MRQARAGDTLTHQQLTGEDLSTPNAPTIHAMPAVNIAPSGPATSGGVPELTERAERAPAQLPSQQPQLTVQDALAEIDENLVVDLGPENDVGLSVEQTPTSVYDTPSWPGEADRAAAQAAPAPAQSEAQKKDRAAATKKAQADAQKKAQDDIQRQIEAQAAAASPPPAREPVAGPAPQLNTLPSPPKAPSSVDGRGRAVPLPSQPAAGQASGQAARGPGASTGTQTVVTTVGPPPKKPTPSVEQQPSIVIAMDLDPSEPTVVGASMPGPSTARSGQAAGGFGEGAAHESLIIDFDAGEQQQHQQQQEPEQPQEKIRPAAKPVGKPVAATVATTKRRVADDAGPAGMPPPTRRR
jgi:hypothetical protein